MSTHSQAGLHNRDVAADYVSTEAYENYLKNNPHNDSRFIHSIEEGSWIDEENSEHVTLVGAVRLRAKTVPLPSLSDYSDRGIELESECPAIFELCRYLAATARDKVLASESERRVSVLPEMVEILLLEDWHHPDVLEELPSEVESFRMIAEVLATGDPSIYKPMTESNTHWTNWPDGGTL